MRVQSGGNLKTVSWSGPLSQWPGSRLVELSGYWASYGEIYRRQLWVYVVVNKLARATARLPLQVYRGDEESRRLENDSGYASLLARPNRKHSPFRFWFWTVATRKVYGEAFWTKVRDQSTGAVAELVPLHPTAMTITGERDGRPLWSWDNGAVRVTGIPARDVVHFAEYNPDDAQRGLSPLEPLRSTLENEDAARRATSAFWRNAGRPSVALSHPGALSPTAATRLKADWERIHSGADNFGKVAILEEGMRPEKLSLTAEEAQYIESRKLNREEVCAAYDVPPSGVQILDNAKYANITEQNRALYRDTLAPELRFLEAELRHQLRDEPNPRTGVAEFDPDLAALFDLDDVLRGAFETRVESYQKAINSAWMMPSEVRRAEGLPPAEGADQLFVNSTMIPLTTALTAGAPNQPGGGPAEAEPGVEAETPAAEPSGGDGKDVGVRINAAGILVRSGFEPQDSLRAVGLDPIKHLGLLPVTLQSKKVVEAGAQAAREQLQEDAGGDDEDLEPDDDEVEDEAVPVR